MPRDPARERRPDAGHGARRQDPLIAIAYFFGILLNSMYSAFQR